jgi:hypothetical protein
LFAIRGLFRSPRVPAYWPGGMSKLPGKAHIILKAAMLAAVQDSAMPLA